MPTVTVRIPADYTMDAPDRERNLIGLIWQARPQVDGSPITITGVRCALRYHSPNAAWPTVQKSRVARPGNLVTIRYSTEGAPTR